MKKNTPFNQKMYAILNKYLPIKSYEDDYIPTKYIKKRRNKIFSPSKTFSTSLSPNNYYTKLNHQISDNRINKKIKVYSELYKTNKYPIDQDKFKIKEHPYQSEKKLNDFMKTIKFEEEKNDFKKVVFDRSNEIYKRNIKNFLDNFRNNNKPQRRYFVSNLNKLKGNYIKKSVDFNNKILFLSDLEKEKIKEKDEFQNFLKFETIK